MRNITYLALRVKIIIKYDIIETEIINRLSLILPQEE